MTPPKVWHGFAVSTGQTRAYALNPAILDERLARGEGVVTLWGIFRIS